MEIRTISAELGSKVKVKLNVLCSVVVIVGSIHPGAIRG